jgi:hypothetical protein
MMRSRRCVGRPLGGRERASSSSSKRGPLTSSGTATAAPSHDAHVAAAFLDVVDSARATCGGAWGRVRKRGGERKKGERQQVAGAGRGRARARPGRRAKSAAAHPHDESAPASFHPSTRLADSGRQRVLAGDRGEQHVSERCDCSGASSPRCARSMRLFGKKEGWAEEEGEEEEEEEEERRGARVVGFERSESLRDGGTRTAMKGSAPPAAAASGRPLGRSSSRPASPAPLPLSLSIHSPRSIPHRVPAVPISPSIPITPPITHTH